MSETTAMPGFPGPVQPAQKQPKRWLKWAIPLFAFLVGVGVGGTGQEKEDVTAAPAYVSLKSELTETQDQADELAEEVEAAEERIERATAAGEERLAQQTAEQDARSAELDAREQALVSREAAAAAAEAAKPAPAAPKPAPAAPKPAPAPAVQAPAPAPQVQAPAPSAYYKNCDAARAAGAAPVRRGDAGYGSHLDRDDDGIGCE
ncbi:Excalibur calcium-binding domain-containing protein [Blastococcus fimeti]|nr:Excalibur calcium-binding domain-containing protein [Blastococcus fimeti]